MVPTASGKVRPASCRDKGRSGVDEGAWCLSWWHVGWSGFPEANRSHPHETSTRPPPISASTPCPYRTQADLPNHSPSRSSKFIRGEGGERWLGKKDTGYLYKALMVARCPLDRCQSS